MASAYKGEQAGRSTAEMRLFIDSGKKIIELVANPASAPKRSISESHSEAVEDH
jgi:hypothetical protein